MATVKRLLKGVETRTLVWLAKSRMSSLVIVGTLAVAGFSTAALGGQSSTPAQHMQPHTSATLPLSAYGCYNDPDGDGHIFCDGTVAITALPASFGQCRARAYYEAGSPIVCRGTGW
jgi:hypothetical protein